MRTDSTIYEIAESFRKKLLAGETRATQQIVRSFRAGEQKINQKLNQLVAKVEAAERAGKTPSVAWTYQMDRYQELLMLIDMEINRAALGASALIADHQKINAILALEGVAEMAGSVALLRTSFIALDRSSVLNIVGTLTDGSPLSRIFREMGNGAIGAARRILPSAMAAGQNPRKTAVELSNAIESLGRERALLISRTEQLRAFRMSQQQSYKSNHEIFSGWRWMSARDARTCPICIAMDGTVHPLSEIFGSHPACRCTTVPVLRIHDEYNVGTGEEWFARQTASVQENMLGPGRYELYKDGTTLGDMVKTVHSEKWGPGKRLKTLAELAS